MTGVVSLTLKKLKEPAFIIMLILALVFAYLFSGTDSPGAGSNENLLLLQIISAESGYSPATSTLFVLGITILISIFLGASEIPRDIDSGVILLIMAKPVSKTQYLIGKFIGITAICALIYFAGLLTAFASSFIDTGRLPQIGFVLRQAYVFLAIPPAAALSVMFSCFLPDISGIIVSTIYILFSLFFCFIPIALALLPRSIVPESASALIIIYYFFPNFAYFFQKTAAFGVIPLMLAVYSVSVTAIFILIGSKVLTSRDLV